MLPPRAKQPRHYYGHPFGHEGGGGCGAGTGSEACCRPSNRLNLLLSWGGWRPESWADRMASLLEPMGVQSHKAASACQAEQVIRRHEVHIAVVDLGLPLDLRRPGQEGGARVLDLLRRLDHPPPTVIVNSPRSARDASRDMAAALRFDAFAIVERTSADVELMLKVLQRALDRFYRGRWPAPP